MAFYQTGMKNRYLAAIAGITQQTADATTQADAILTAFFNAIADEILQNARLQGIDSWGDGHNSGITLVNFTGAGMKIRYLAAIASLCTQQTTDATAQSSLILTALFSAVTDEIQQNARCSGNDWGGHSHGNVQIAVFTAQGMKTRYLAELTILTEQQTTDATEQADSILYALFYSICSEIKEMARCAGLDSHGDSHGNVQVE
jgi:nucleoid DNA-binding protein